MRTAWKKTELIIGVPESKKQIAVFKRCFWTRGNDWGGTTWGKAPSPGAFPSWERGFRACPKCLCVSPLQHVLRQGREAAASGFCDSCL